MELQEEITRERDALLQEYDRLEAVKSILKKRKLYTPKGVKQAILQELHGGLFHNGLWRIERRVNRYFEELMKKLKDADSKLRKELQVLAKNVLISASQGGTLYDLIEEENIDLIDWPTVEEEVTSLEENITALIALLEKTKMTEERRNYDKIMERLTELVGSDLLDELNKTYYPQSRNKRFVDFLALHWDDFNKTLQHLQNLNGRYFNYPYSLLMDLRTLFPLIESGLVSYDDLIKPLLDLSLEKGDFTNSGLVQVIESMVESKGFTKHKAKTFIAFLQRLDARNIHNCIGLISYVIQSKKIDYETALEIGDMVFESKFFNYFNSTEDIPLFKFADTLLQLVKEKNIDLIYAIDRGGRILGVLSYHILSGLKMKIPCYFILVNRKGEVSPYSKDFQKIIKNKNILLIDEFVRVGGTIRGAKSYFINNGAKSVESLVFSSNIGGYNSVFSELPSWYYKKEYSGFIETGKFDNLEDKEYMDKFSPEVRTAIQNRAPIVANKEWGKIMREVRLCLKILAKAIVIYLKEKKNY